MRRIGVVSDALPSRNTWWSRMPYELRGEKRRITRPFRVVVAQSFAPTWTKSDPRFDAQLGKF